MSGIGGIRSRYIWIMKGKVMHFWANQIGLSYGKESVNSITQIL